jgi:hypothetical protein
MAYQEQNQATIYWHDYETPNKNKHLKGWKQFLHTFLYAELFLTTLELLEAVDLIK